MQYTHMNASFALERRFHSVAESYENGEFLTIYKQPLHTSHQISGLVLDHPATHCAILLVLSVAWRSGILRKKQPQRYVSPKGFICRSARCFFSNPNKAFICLFHIFFRLIITMNFSPGWRHVIWQLKWRQI